MVLTNTADHDSLLRKLPRRCNMLRMIDNSKELSLGAARAQFPKSKLIFVITDMSNISDIKGIVFMVSDDDASFDELCREDAKLRKQGKQTIIAGSYENGGAIGVQYEVR